MTGRVMIVGGCFRAARALEATLVAGSLDVAITTRDQDALALVRADSCDVAILDARQTCQDQLSLCRALKAERPSLPVLLVTPEAPLHRLRALEVGADEVIGGCDSSVLILRVGALAHLRRLTDDASRLAALQGNAPGVASPESARILVLDPDQRSRTRLAEVLAGSYQVTALAEPSRGLIEAAGESFAVAWVSQDWTGWDGLKLSRQLRLVDRTGRLRMLLIAGEDLPRPQALLECGIDDLIQRPLDRCEALARTRTAALRHSLTAPAPEIAWPDFTPAASRFSLVHRSPPERFAA